MSVIRAYFMVCETCDFTTKDAKLMDNHNCDTAQFGGSCQDFPCCGHEAGDCNGLKYGSDESIKEYATAHSMCDHENGYYECYDQFECDDEDCETLGTCTC